MKITHRVGLMVEDAFNEAGQRGVDGRDGIAGKPGERGLQGERGEPGERGADAKGWNYRGEYRRTATYEAGDVVSYSGSSYLALVDSKGNSPPSKAWGLLAARGEDGEDGVSQRGPRGLPGTTTVVTAGGSDQFPFIADADISTGQPLRVSSAGHCDLADASNFATAEVVALASVDTANGMAGLMQAGDSLTLEDWSAVVGSTSLTAGLAYYLSTTPGMLATTPPTELGECVVFVARATDSQTLLIEIASLIVLSEVPEE